MVDVVNGQIRIRAWPKPRGPKANPEQAENRERFTEAQRAFKYLAPNAAQWLIEATEGTPLLPRDLLTAQVFGRLVTFALDDGRRMYPKVILKEVSEALDVISQTPGTGLKRGAEFWEAAPPSAGNQWAFHQSLTISTPVSELVFTDLEQFNEFRLIAIDVTGSVATGRRYTFSTDNQATWKTAAGDYKILTNAATTTNATGILLWTNSTTGAVSDILDYEQSVDPAPGIASQIRMARQHFFNFPGSIVTDARLRPDSGTLNAGTIICLGR